MIVCIAPYESGIGWQSLTAAQGNCLMAFTGALRFFNSEFTLPEQRAAFLGGNAPLGLTAQNLDELVVWLSLECPTVMLPARLHGQAYTSSSSKAPTNLSLSLHLA
jgi:hypothetical protein